MNQKRTKKKKKKVWKKKMGKLLLIIPIIVFVVYTSFILLFGIPISFKTPVLEFPIAQTESIDRLSPYGVPDWSGPGTHHNGIDLFINDSVTIIAPSDGTILAITRRENKHSENHNILFSIKMQVNQIWLVDFVIEPNYDGDDDEMNALQEEGIKVAVMQRISEGDAIAELLYSNDGSHLHFSVYKMGNDVCPYQYSSEIAQNTYDNYEITENYESLCV